MPDSLEDPNAQISRRAFFERWIVLAAVYPLTRSFAQPADVHSTSLTFAGHGATLHGYLSRPKAGGPFPAVMLIHDQRGIDDGIRAAARRMAANGYVTLVPDLLSRKGGTRAFGLPHGSFDTFTEDDLARDLTAAEEYLNAHPMVRSRSAVARIRASLF